MTKEQRDKILGSFSEPVRASLLDFYEEKRKKLADLSTAVSWEEVLGRQWAVKHIIGSLFQYLKIEKIEKIEKTNYA